MFKCKYFITNLILLSNIGLLQPKRFPFLFYTIGVFLLLQLEVVTIEIAVSDYWPISTEDTVFSSTFFHMRLLKNIWSNGQICLTAINSKQPQIHCTNNYKPHTCCVIFMLNYIFKQLRNTLHISVLFIKQCWYLTHNLISVVCIIILLFILRYS